jgi:hypothetical protein
VEIRCGNPPRGRLGSLIPLRPQAVGYLLFGFGLPRTASAVPTRLSLKVPEKILLQILLESFALCISVAAGFVTRTTKPSRLLHTSNCFAKALAFQMVMEQSLGVSLAQPDLGSAGPPMVDRQYRLGKIIGQVRSCPSDQ